MPMLILVNSSNDFHGLVVKENANGEVPISLEAHYIAEVLYMMSSSEAVDLLLESIITNLGCEYNQRTLALAWDAIREHAIKI